MPNLLRSGEGNLRAEPLLVVLVILGVAGDFQGTDKQLVRAIGNCSSIDKVCRVQLSKEIDIV